MNPLLIIGLATGLLPLVGGIIHGVESLFGKGNGASKKEAAQAALVGVLNSYTMVQPFTGLPKVDTAAYNAAVSALIDATVAFFNATGIFQHGS